ncbi:MAG: permease [Verrucomicrobiota bacterium]|nr:permease [Verrucomicrobiota bacterium]
MNLKRELSIGAGLCAAFLCIYFLPVGEARFDRSLNEALELCKWYAREHVVLCLLPAFWIAGAIAAFVSQASVIRYLGPKASRPIAYGVGSVSGAILAVCSCTVLPLFAGIYRMGAGLGPATAFLYSGPAINALAIILTAKVLGLEMGIARAVGAVVFSVIIGLIMAWLFRHEEHDKHIATKAVELPDSAPNRPLWQTVIFFATMVGILVFSNWGGAADGLGFFSVIYKAKWIITAALALGFAWELWAWYKLPLWGISIIAIGVGALALLVPGQPQWPFLMGVLGLAWLTAGRDGEAGEWFEQTWGYTKQIMPLLLGGVLVAGFLLGRPGHEALIPAEWITSSVGGNSFVANLFAAVAGAFMYFATLTEIPILQGLMGSGMGKGPALTLLLAGPALSLPSMLVLNTILGTRKNLTYIALVILMSTLTGWIYGLTA